KVRFTEAGLRSLFTQPFGGFQENFLRRTMRLIVLANYLNDDLFAPRAWCYWTPWIQADWAQGQGQFMNHPKRNFTNIAPSPLKNLKAPDSVLLQQGELGQLSKLYYIEDDLVKGMRKLSSLIQSKTKLNPREFENAMGDFGSALKRY